MNVSTLDTALESALGSAFSGASVVREAGAAPGQSSLFKISGLNGMTPTQMETQLLGILQRQPRTELSYAANRVFDDPRALEINLTIIHHTGDCRFYAKLLFDGTLSISTAGLSKQ